MDICAAFGCAKGKAALYQSEIGEGLFTLLAEFTVCAEHLEVASTGQGFKLKAGTIKVISVGTRRGHDSAVFDLL